jgi:pilus assembly protein Flp/PilA
MLIAQIPAIASADSQPVLFSQEEQMYSIINKFLRDERGATSIEYGLIAAGIGVAVVTLVGQVGGEIQTLFTNLKVQLSAFNGTSL